MRIIGGKFSGRRIGAPEGLIARPTTDRTRESLFNILASRDDFDFEDTRVLDLFAGSGALGIEALSRGASWCLFVEIDAAARATIRENIEALNLFGATRVHRRSAATLGQKPAGDGPAFDLAFLDPPYNKDLCAPAMETLDKGGWLAPSALTVVEQAESEPAVSADGFTEVDRRHYGAAQIGIYRYRA